MKELPDYQYLDVYAKCPFYIKNTATGILCEGSIPGTITEHTFGDEGKKGRSFGRFCCAEYRECAHYKTLNDIYEKQGEK